MQSTGSPETGSAWSSPTLARSRPTRAGAAAPTPTRSPPILATLLAENGRAHDTGRFESEGLFQIGSAIDARLSLVRARARTGIERPEGQRLSEDPVAPAAAAGPLADGAPFGETEGRGAAGKTTLLAAIRIEALSRAPDETGRSALLHPSAGPVPVVDARTPVRELGNRLPESRLDSELPVETGDLQCPEYAAIVRNENEPPSALGEPRQRPEQNPERRRVDEGHFSEIHDGIAPPVAQHPVQLPLERRRREGVDLSRHGDDVRAGRELCGADLEAYDGHASSVESPA